MLGPDTSPAQLPPDDLVLPFAVKALNVRGRVVRLGSVVDDIVSRHEYPPSVSALLAETVALTAMLGSSLKFDGKFILQTSSDGPVDMLVADYASPGLVRGYAHFDPERVEALENGGVANAESLLGKGHLAMTIDQGSDMERYQGIVPLEGSNLTDAAKTYFAQSEQIPTSLHLSSGPLVGRGAGQPESWRAGAIMIQHLPEEGGASPLPLSSGDAPPGHEEAPAEDDDWVKARFLHETVEHHELLDPMLAPERLLYRLFHEDGVTVFPTSAIQRHCSCSRDTILRVLNSFTQEERTDMADDGEIEVTCEFCSAQYRFNVAELDEPAST